MPESNYPKNVKSQRYVTVGGKLYREVTYDDGTQDLAPVDLPGTPGAAAAPATGGGMTLDQSADNARLIKAAADAERWRQEQYDFEKAKYNTGIQIDAANRAADQAIAAGDRATAEKWRVVANDLANRQFAESQRQFDVSQRNSLRGPRNYIKYWRDTHGIPDDSVPEWASTGAPTQTGPATVASPGATAPAAGANTVPVWAQPAPTQISGPGMLTPQNASLLKNNAANPNYESNLGQLASQSEALRGLLTAPSWVQPKASAAAVPAWVGNPSVGMTRNAQGQPTYAGTDTGITPVASQIAQRDASRKAGKVLVATGFNDKYGGDYWDASAPLRDGARAITDPNEIAQYDQRFRSTLPA